MKDAFRHSAFAQRRQPSTPPEASAPERPNQMSFAEQFMEALGEHIDARISYAETRRGPNAEYANSDEVNKTGERLQGLLDKVRFAL